MRFLPTRALAACLLLATLAACPAPPDPARPPQQAMTLPLTPRPTECVLPYEPVPSELQRDGFCRAQQLRADACAANDGAWGVPGLSPPGTQPGCSMPTPDAGRVCSSNSQCRQSACVPDAHAAAATPGNALGHCDKYGTVYPRCNATLVNGAIETPVPCPLI